MTTAIARLMPEAWQATNCAFDELSSVVADLEAYYAEVKVTTDRRDHGDGDSHYIVRYRSQLAR